MKEALLDALGDSGATKDGDSIHIGQIVAIDRDGHAFVEYQGNPNGPIQAYFTHSLKLQMENPDRLIGQKVLLVFNEEVFDLPVIVDTLHSKICPHNESDAVAVSLPEPDEISVDGRRVVLDAEKEIILKCGKSSIQLNKDGRIVIRGIHLLTRASGVHRINGGSVQIN